MGRCGCETVLKTDLVHRPRRLPGAGGGLPAGLRCVYRHRRGRHHHPHRQVGSLLGQAHFRRQRRHFGLYRRGGAPSARFARPPGEGGVPGGAAAHALCGAAPPTGQPAAFMPSTTRSFPESRRKSSTTTWCWDAAPTATGRTALLWPHPQALRPIPSRQGAR